MLPHFTVHSNIYLYVTIDNNKKKCEGIYLSDLQMSHRKTQAMTTNVIFYRRLLHHKDLELNPLSISTSIKPHRWQCRLLNYDDNSVKKIKHCKVRAWSSFIL